MTRRKDIEEILSQNKISLQEIANIFRTDMKEILEDFQHIVKSVQPEREVVMEPAQCRDCGFIFKERSKIKTPSKCPRCRNERITPPLFTIRKRKN